MSKCELYEQRKAKRGDFLRDKKVFCNENCPYGNQVKAELFEYEISFCKTGGMTENTNSPLERKESLLLYLCENKTAIIIPSQ